MSNPEAIRRSTGIDQDQKFCIEGVEYVKIKPFDFKTFLAVKNGCDDYDGIICNFARKFGLTKDISPAELVKFLNEEDVDDWNQNIEWLEDHKFIKAVENQESYIYGTRFWNRKNNELMLIQTDNGYSLVDLKSGKCPYGEGEPNRKNKVTRKDLWEFFEGLSEKEFLDFIKSAH